jgi:UDP-N-acetylmuramate--alanine ligase
LELRRVRFDVEEIILFSLQKRVRLHFVGIGGIGMSGMAQCLKTMGHQVSGSDIALSGNILKLEKQGIKVFLGHRAENIEGATLVVYSSAISEGNPEIERAKQLNLPIMQRAEMLAELMRLKVGLAVAGTHGKTTSTSFLATILQEAALDPTYIIGGVVENLNGHAKVGQGDFLVAEADESDGSFLRLSPVMSMITSIDDDHLDYYGSRDGLFQSFVQFANNVPFYGLCALCVNDPLTERLQKEMKKPFCTFGIRQGDVKRPDFAAENIRVFKFKTEYDLYINDKFASKVTINIPGKHNVLNSLGAIALAYNLNVDIELITRSISKFKGVGRRFELLYQGENVEIIDDYGHHPTEISSTIKTVKETRPEEKLRVIFEPHRFSRTRDCWESFIHCFEGASEVIMLPVYTAGEKIIPGVNSQNLAREINAYYKGLVKTLDSEGELKQYLVKQSKEKQTILVLGAGSIGKKTREIVEMF